MDKGSAVLVLYWSRVPMGAVGQDTALADRAWPVYTQCVRVWRREIAAKEALDYWYASVRFQGGIAFGGAVCDRRLWTQRVV
jgi:hypothetical protein